MKIKSKKFMLISLLAVVVIVVVVINLTSSGNGQTTVQADLAFIDDISEIVTASGRIQPQTKVDITAEVSAQIIQVFVAEGDLVNRGERLLQLDTVQLKADVAQARYSLDEITARTKAARTEFDRQELEFKRQTALFEQKLTSETEFTNARFTFDNAQANYDAMLAQMKTGQARLDKVVDNLSKTSITAPMAGVVTYLSAEAGEIAQAQTAYTQGQTLMTIADLSVFEVEVDVDETEIAKLAIDQTAGIRVDALRDTVFEGTVVEIGNSATVIGQGSDEFSTTFRVKVRFADVDPAIRPGMSATVDITTATDKDALLIPYASVVTREFDPDSLKAKADQDTSSGLVAAVQAAEVDTLQQPTADTIVSEDNGKKSGRLHRKRDKIKISGVFIVKDGKAVFVEVLGGIADERNLVALTGVTPGDTVISGSFQTLRKLKDGDAVEIESRSLDKMKEYEQ